MLDVATGAGHTAAAVAPQVREVVAIDLASEMIDETRALAAARGLSNLEARVMDVEALDFPSRRFDAVTCRIAPHHFLDFPRAIGEMARVLAPGGRLLIEDSCVPEDASLDRFLNEVDRLRDPTHVRSYTESEWRATLEAAGFTVTETTLYRKSHPVAEWVQRSGLRREGVERVYAAFAAAGPETRRYFEIQFEDGRATEFTDDKLILRADKRSPAG